MNIPVLDLNGKSSAKIELPSCFEEPLRIDLIRRLFHSERSFSFQPKGNFWRAGLQTTAGYFGRRHAKRQTINRGMSRLPRIKLPKGRLGAVRIVPFAAKGRRAHPPKPYKRIVQRINIKEKNKAIRSAIAATANLELVKKRGHKFGSEVPLVVSDSFESIKKTKQVIDFLKKIGVWKDIERSKKTAKKRTSRKSVLIVVGEDKGIWKAARNLPGVDVVDAEKLTAQLLAPGGEPGRLTLWTESAVEKIENENLYE